MRWLAALACGAALVLAGCGEKHDVLEPSGSKSVELMLDYFPNADHAGIYAAQAGGDFKQAGLDVQIRQPPDPADLPPGVYDERPAPAPPRRGYAWSRSPAAGAASPPLAAGRSPGAVMLRLFWHSLGGAQGPGEPGRDH